MDYTMSDEQVCLHSGPEGDLRVKAEDEPSFRASGVAVSPMGAAGTAFGNGGLAL